MGRMQIIGNKLASLSSFATTLSFLTLEGVGILPPHLSFTAYPYDSAATSYTPERPPATSFDSPPCVVATSVLSAHNEPTRSSGPSLARASLLAYTCVESAPAELPPTMLDALDLFDESDTMVPVAFRGTALYENKIYLSEGLERKENHQMVLEPMIPTIHNQDPWASDDTDESDDEEAFSPRTFHVYEAVSGAFGPAGGNANMDFKVEKSPATYPAVQKMILLTELGEEIEIRPRCKPRRKVLRGCVELAIAEWMKEQRKLPQGHPKKAQRPVHGCTVQHQRTFEDSSGLVVEGPRAGPFQRQCLQALSLSFPHIQPP
ncbi:hypothetical protein NP233_g7609 [Leucocoprinus birnbaumii]|uniref:Uncharacterized protein n=1 Tax=Leucocoprinus birnbaumii TaxID=56174 RepID=A0AAD5VP06_9AGAR|nr:hypothetical protein NP233_g7609 [Leucocoprinus birnbaumii]